MGNGLASVRRWARHWLRKETGAWTYATIIGLTIGAGIGWALG